MYNNPFFCVFQVDAGNQISINKKALRNWNIQRFLEDPAFEAPVDNSEALVLAD